MADETVAAILGETLDRSTRALVEYRDLRARHAREIADLQAIQQGDAERARAEMIGLGISVAGLLAAHLQRLFPGATVTVAPDGYVNLRPSDHKSVISIYTAPPCDWRGHGTLVTHETCQMLKRRRVRRERAAAKHQIRTNPDEADRAPLPSGDSRYLA